MLEIPTTQCTHSLLLFIHGFLGSENSFFDFPSDLTKLINQSQNHTTFSYKILPRFDTKDNTTHAIQNLLTYIQTQQHSSIYLCCHSMGGILASDAFLSSQTKIKGIIAFDTPFYGLHHKVYTTVSRDKVVSIISPFMENIPVESLTGYASDAISASSTFLSNAVNVGVSYGAVAGNTVATYGAVAGNTVVSHAYSLVNGLPDVEGLKAGISNAYSYIPALSTAKIVNTQEELEKVVQETSQQKEVSSLSSFYNLSTGLLRSSISALSSTKEYIYTTKKSDDALPIIGKEDTEEQKEQELFTDKKNFELEPGEAVLGLAMYDSPINPTTKTKEGAWLPYIAGAVLFIGGGYYIGPLLYSTGITAGGYMYSIGASMFIQRAIMGWGLNQAREAVRYGVFLYPLLGNIQTLHEQIMRISKCVQDGEVRFICFYQMVEENGEIDYFIHQPIPEDTVHLFKGLKTGYRDEVTGHMNMFMRDGNEEFYERLLGETCDFLSR